MKSLLHKVIILSCALYLSGAHWMALQCTAWTGMLVSRAISTSVPEALSSTFDGQHPCALCSAIAEGRCNEDDAGAGFVSSKKAGDIKFLKLLSDGPPVGARKERLVTWPGFTRDCVVRVTAPLMRPPIG